MEFVDPKSLVPDVYKFVNVRGEYRFFNPSRKHRDAVQPGENAWEAGMIAILPDNKSFSIVDDSSETLHVYGVKAQGLEKALGRKLWVETAMTSAEVEKVLADVAEEGMWYAFDSYSEYREIADERFHELRRAFVAAGNALNKYLESRKDKKDGHK